MIQILKYTFTYQTITYTAFLQIRNKKDVITINIGEFGDTFPCIMLKYTKKDNVFSIDKLRAQPFGGYSEDDRVLCIRPSLPEKGALNILVLLSLAIINDMLDKGIVKNSKIKIFDLAINDRYPISWYKYFIGKKETAYSKYGFIIRNIKKNISFDNYMNQIIPNILNQKMSIFSKDEDFQYLLQDFNGFLRSKKLRAIKFSMNETIEDFIKRVLDTKRPEKYSELLEYMNAITEFDIRGTWYWSKDYYEKNVTDKIQIINIDNI